MLNDKFSTSKTDWEFIILAFNNDIINLITKNTQ